MAQRQAGDTGAALNSIEAALAISGEGGRTAWGAYWLLELARVQRALEQPAEALVSYQRSATIQRHLGDRGREAMALDGTGEAYQELGRLDEAAKFHLLAAATHRELGDRWHLAVALVNLGSALVGLAAPEQARPHLAEAAAILTEFDDPRAVRLRERSTQLMAT